MLVDVLISYCQSRVAVMFHTHMREFCHYYVMDLVEQCLPKTLIE